MRAKALVVVSAPLISFALLACESPAPEPVPTQRPVTEQTATPATAALTAERTKPASTQVKADKKPSRTGAKPVKEVPVSPDDPLKGKWTLAEATQGLTGKGKLYADIQTGLGKLSCELYEDRAPITVANFVGLARGLRPFKDKGAWVKKPGYDGTTFHRVIKGFMIQGGDPQGTGGGEPGYVIPDEIWEGAAHDRRGLLCMANRGPNTNGMQFFITDAAAAHLDGGYTIFGECKPEDVIEKLASVPVSGDRAQSPTKIESIKIRREK
jgi:peptidyl-prolyl cis-trans isomerase A (cyclophilin A)